MDKRRNWNIAPFKYEYNTVNGRKYVRDSTYWTAAQLYNRNNAKFRRTYEKPARNKNGTPENYPLLRYADVLLMLVEAENEVNGATPYGAGYLKEVRDRANASDVTATVTGDVDAMRTAVRKERFLELAFEGQRKWDLIRWGIFVSEMQQSAQEIRGNAGSFAYAAMSGERITVRNNLFPIPVLELSLNSALTQNPGW